MNWTVYCADVLTWCEDYAAKIERGEELPFHAIFTDPPYGLSDTPDMAEVLTHWLAGDDYEHKGGGMMGKSWDSFVPGPAVWAALRRVCHPGAYLFAFGGTRTADLLSVALRLGGWERFDEIDVLGGSISWIQGSGFPKSTAIGKSIDRAANAKREVVGESNTRLQLQDHPHCYSGGWNGKERTPNGGVPLTAPATPLAAAWQGHGSATKPSHEPVLCFRNPLAKVPSDRIHAVTGWDWWHSEKLLKDTPHTRLKMLKKHGCRLPPLYGDSNLVLITRKALHERVETDKLFVARAKRQWREAPTEPVTLARVDVKAYRRWSSKTYAANCLSTGAGALWIDGSRVMTDSKDLDQMDRHKNPTRTGWICASPDGTYSPNTQGRWPPNVCLTHISPRPCSRCSGSGFVPATPIEETWEEWYDKTKDYGGTHEEWECLREPGGTSPCQFCDGGWLPGCERLGVKRVGSGERRDEVERERYKSWRTMEGCDLDKSPPLRGKANSPDSYGIEQVTAYACVLACDACSHQWTAEQRGACPECGGEARWACAVAELGEMSGERKSGARKGGDDFKLGRYENQDGHWGLKKGGSCESSRGTAARFYPQHDWQHEIAERLAGVVPFRYVAKSSRRERDSGLDSLQPVEYNEANITGGEQWENTDQSQVTQAEEDTQPQKDTTDSQSGIQKPSQVETSSPTIGSGSKQTDQSQKDIASIIQTGISKITDSKTLNSLTQQLTNESIADVNSEMEFGGNPVSSVENSSQSIKNTGISQERDGRNTDDADSATSEKWSKKNVNVKQGHNCYSDFAGTPEHASNVTNTPRLNTHPCCKPISLTKWLATLLLPPPEYAPRRVLVPFAGSGSEMAGCLLVGFDEIVGVEMSEEYCDIARARLRFWADWAARGYDDPAAILKAAKREETQREEAQMELL